MILLILKFIHVATIALWAGGLMSLPFIYNQRKGLEEEALFRLHIFTRYFYVALVSPAAFVAIASGTVLIFLQETYVPWFSVKLLLVGILTFIHILCGLTILRLFEPDRSYPLWRALTMTSVTIAVVVGILFVVLGKPAVSRIDDFNGLFRPGELGRLLGGFIAWPI